MSGLAIAPEAISAYLQNVVDGCSMRKIARAMKCEASTALRRIRVCEELREHREWDALFTALEVHHEAEDTPHLELLNRGSICTALGITARHVGIEFAAHMDALVKPGSMVLAGDMTHVAVLEAAKTMPRTMARAVMLAALAFGWITPIGDGARRVRKFTLTDAALETMSASQRRALIEAPKGKSRKRYSPPRSPLEMVLSRSQDLITPDHLHAAQSFQLTYITRETATAGEYRAITKALPQRLLTALVEVCGEGTGLEAMERKMGLPSRSGKAVVAIALEVLSHANRAA